jgi:imidazolonepropionase-like amidohydrolase
MWDAGVLITAGTDAPYPGVFLGEGLHRELELLVEAGLSPVQAITAGTLNAARFMGAEGEWGSLEAGKLANILVIDGDPSREISDTRRIDRIIKEGVVLDRESLRYDPARDPGFRATTSVSGN